MRKQNVPVLTLEQSAHTRYNRDELKRHSAKWMNPDTKGHTLYDYVVMKCIFQNKEIYRQDMGYVGGESGTGFLLR